MKFKKIEISAFRIFDDPKNATFDLTAKSGNAAGFISLYAPNGFGKTSFYDAVEFGITKSVNRFYLRSKELEKLADFQNVKNELPFIRNSKSSLDTYIKIYTDQDDKVINTTFKKHGNQTHDLNFKKPVVHDFQKVILSQEWISAFLTESNGEERYKKFMENPELSEINNYYNNLKYLWTSYKDKANELDRNVSEHKLKIQVIETENILEAVNKQIALLQEKHGETSLVSIKLSSTTEEIINFKDTISNRIISANRESVLTQLLDYVSIAKSGRDHVVGIESFFASKKLLEGIVQKITINELILRKFDEFGQLNVELENSKKSQLKLISEKEHVLNTIILFDEYERVFNDLQDKEKKRSIQENDLLEANKRLEDFKRTEILTRNQLEAALRQIEEFATKKSKFPFLRTELDRLNLEIKEIEKTLSDTKIELELESKKYRDNETSVSSTRKIIQEIGRDQYPQISSDEDAELSKTITDLSVQKKALLNEQEKLKGLEIIIDKQQTLNSTIDEFIKAGLSIVNEQQDSTCPLCEHVYKSYNELVEKITSNKSLDESLKKLLSEKSTIKDQMTILLDSIKSNRDRLLKFYNGTLNGLVEKEQEIKNRLDGFENIIKSSTSNLAVVLEKKDNYNMELDGLAPEDFENKINENISQATTIRDSSNLAHSKNKEDVDKGAQLVETLKNTIDLLKKEVVDLKLNEQYLFIINWYKENVPAQEIDKMILTQKELYLTNSISQFGNKQQELKERIGVLNKDLASLKRDNVLLEKADLDKALLGLQGRINNYQNFLKDQLSIDVSSLDETSLFKLLENKQIELNSEQAKFKGLLEDYQKLEKYSEHILPFLQSEDAKLKLAEAEGKLTFLNNHVKPIIEDEREKAKGYLDARVKNFFYENLINELYKKIDPHPDFKSVQFIANFDADNPRLDVFIKNTKNENTLIPNLYFSTAQINILSLSIFLAGALNSKEYQCIFIDDPIQSMDSINVLSTIDLLRSLVVNEGKQIILSTHDENFHNLLKKKMPPDLFESKFLELESFGKVKI